eukprot:jgi/Mesvir1/21281/Mv21676-RA.2
MAAYVTTSALLTASPSALAGNGVGLLSSRKTAFVTGARVPVASGVRKASVDGLVRGAKPVKAIATEPSLKRAYSPPQHLTELLSNDPEELAKSIKYHAEHSSVNSPNVFGVPQMYRAVAESVRERVIERLNETMAHFDKENTKAVHYVSMEFLQGRYLTNAIGNLGLTGAYAEALKKLGYNLEEVATAETDAALGNGGLGRLASCFLDSLATLNYPAFGYGLRYRYGLFKQLIREDGQQVEVAEDWLEKPNPWEVPRFDVQYPIRFFGTVEKRPDGKRVWTGGEEVSAMAYDTPVPGYQTKNVIPLRLWTAKVPIEKFDLASFNAGDLDKADHLARVADQICSVLYPGDATEAGKLLRLKQQYMMCSASLQDMIARFKARHGGKYNWDDFPKKNVLQMNDTHPSLAVPELMRLLIDVEGLTWEKAWAITTKTCAYTNHTVLPEALEKWPYKLVKKLLPRHTQIIHRIDNEFIHMLRETVKPEDAEDIDGMIERMRILGDMDVDVEADADTPPPKPVVRMANMCVIAGFAVNGVAAIHSEIVKNEVFNEFYKLWPNKFQNKTNGVTARRWLAWCNPALSKVITKWLKTDAWVQDLSLLKGLMQHVDNPELQAEWAAAKTHAKNELAAFVKQRTGVTLDTNTMFDIQVKRIHEYKRQLLNLLGAVYRYKKIKEMSPEQRRNVVPRTIIIGGKAFATYEQAKRIVHLISWFGGVVDRDPVMFIPDYNVTVAEKLIPASELSQHISTAGMEASGTSNMKFQMNGCLIIGTLDGANVEIREEIGNENFFLFGCRADEVAGLRVARAQGKFKSSPQWEELKGYIRSQAMGWDADWEHILWSLEGNEGYGRGDYFLVGQDFPSYLEAQAAVDAAYKDQKSWVRKSIISTATSSKFSSDRTIHEYAEQIWGVKPSPVP